MQHVNDIGTTLERHWKTAAERIIDYIILMNGNFIGTKSLPEFILEYRMIGAVSYRHK